MTESEIRRIVRQEIGAALSKIEAKIWIKKQTGDRRYTDVLHTVVSALMETATELSAKDRDGMRASKEREGA